MTRDRQPRSGLSETLAALKENINAAFLKISRRHTSSGHYRHGLFRHCQFAVGNNRFLVCSASSCSGKQVFHIRICALENPHSRIKSADGTDFSYRQTSWTRSIKVTLTDAFKEAWNNFDFGIAGLDQSFPDLVDGRYIDSGRTIILIGTAGTGKTHLCEALAKQAHCGGKSVLHMPIEELSIDMISSDELPANYANMHADFVNAELVVFNPMESILKDSACKWLCDVIEERISRKKANVIAASIPLEEWVNLLGNQTLRARELLLTSPSVMRFSLNCESYRLRYRRTHN
jgi:DNA replication protein DnaC